MHKFLPRQVTRAAITERGFCNIAPVRIEETSDQQVLTIRGNPSGCLARTWIVTLNEHPNEAAWSRETFDQVSPILGSPRHEPRELGIRMGTLCHRATR